MEFGDQKVLSPQQRRARNRAEVIEAILDTAREIMREEGAGALNLNELARRLNMTTPALYSYFPSKFAIYDALYRQGLQLMRSYDLEVWRSYEPSWERLQAWMSARVQFAFDHPELYHLMFSVPVPGFVPSDSSVAETRLQLENTRTGLAELIDTGVINPGIPTDRAVDLMLAVRHGILAERIGKASVVPAGTDRFKYLVDDALELLRSAWGGDHVTSTKEGGNAG
jgi:AcrR family transcriptional regulator